MSGLQNLIFYPSLGPSGEALEGTGGELHVRVGREGSGGVLRGRRKELWFRSWGDICSYPQIVYIFY